MKNLIVMTILLSGFAFSAKAQLLSVYQADRMAIVLNSEIFQDLLHDSPTVKSIISIEPDYSEVGPLGNPELSNYKITLTENGVPCSILAKVHVKSRTDAQVDILQNSCL